MYVRFKRGDTEANTVSTLKGGEVGVDLEAKTLHFHDGGSPGGYVTQLGEEVWKPPYSGPGPQELIGGDWVSGFYGEVPVNELINGVTLASLIGLTAGTAQYSNQPWLKYIHRGKILFVAKMPYRHTVSWSHIQACGAIHGTGPSLIQIGDDTYKCRLLTGANEDPSPARDGVNPAGTEDSEWNQLIYPIHVDDPLQRGWAQYTDRNLIVGGSGIGNGFRTWCQEERANDTTRACYRSGSTVLRFGMSSKTAGNSGDGWRPVLELVT